jgi:hypothetical protein
VFSPGFKTLLFQIQLVPLRVGIAFTGSGKSLTFVLPMIMSAMMEEKRMPLAGGEVGAPVRVDSP